MTGYYAGEELVIRVVVKCHDVLDEAEEERWHPDQEPPRSAQHKAQRHAKEDDRRPAPQRPHSDEDARRLVHPRRVSGRQGWESQTSAAAPWMVPNAL